MQRMEFLYDNKFEAVFIQRLLNEFELNAKILMREKKYMVYIKEDTIAIGGFNVVIVNK